MKPKVEVKRVPDLVTLDRDIQRLQERMSSLEAMMQRALRIGGPHWVNQVGIIGREVTRLGDAIRTAISAINSLKARGGR